MSKSLYWIGLVALLCLSSCNKQFIAHDVKAVENFDAARYLGTWYEIARFDFKFEKDLDNTMAQYSLLSNGDIQVINSGYHVIKGEYKQATGKAKFRIDPTIGALKVSFFGPFYTGYNVIAIDDDYKYALIAGKDLNYLWILSREKTIPLEIKQAYLEQAQRIGYDTTRLLWINHDRVGNPYLQ